MHSAYAEFAGPRCRATRQKHHHRHERGGIEEIISAMTGRGGPFGDPRMFKAMFWGPGGPGPRGGHRGGPRGPARRGAVRGALLLLIEGGPQNGFQLIQEIERRTDGVWKP